ncbi:MAG: hypothetical protein RBT71_01115 [Flavobacteriales bacterium]|jgi:Spy/CpxP family protein refolding chaperone|nr:hypothetical protein [Flavobacteriales bacterium]
MNVRSIAIAALAIGFAAGTQAQSKGTQDPQVKQQRTAAAQAQAPDRIAHLQKELQLTDDQTQRMRAAEERRRQSMTELRANSGGLDREEQGKRNATIMTAFEEELKGIMNADQFARYKELGKPRAVPARTLDTKPAPPPATE